MLGKPWQQRPHLNGDSGAVGMGIHSTGKIGGVREWFGALQDRLRYVRVCCGDWSRVLGPSPTTNIGVTAVFLDPPYDMRVVSNTSSGRDGAAPTDKLYAFHDNDTSKRVREWAIDHGNNPKLRIALCGYEGEHQMPSSWEVVAWKANGGYGNQSAGANSNADRERVWFSPHCLRMVEEHADHWEETAPPRGPARAPPRLCSELGSTLPCSTLSFSLSNPSERG